MGDRAERGARRLRRPERGPPGEPARVPVDACRNPRGTRVERPAVEGSRAGFRGADPDRSDVRAGPGVAADSSCAPPSIRSRRRSGRSLRQVRKPVKHLQQASGPLAETGTATAKSLADINRLFNAWAYNPPGSEEGYLFWTAWLNHNANSTAQLQDAQGPLARAVVLQSCLTADLAESLATAPAVHPDAAAVHERASERHRLSAGSELRPVPVLRTRHERERRWKLGLRASSGSSSRSASRSRASAWRCSCGSRSAARSRSSPRATDSPSRSTRRRSWRSSPTCASPGVSVGAVKSIELSGTGYADATIELDARVRADSRRTPTRILRQKTLLGETYVELTPGQQRVGLAAGGRHARSGSGLRLGPARRDLPGVRSADAGGVPGLDAGPGRVAARSRRGLLDRDREPRPRSPRRPTACCGCSTARTWPLADFVRNGGEAFGALSERSGQLSGTDPERGRRSLRRPPSATRSSPRSSGSSRPSCASRARR